MEKALQTHDPQCHLQLFGSSLTGFGSKQSDMDMALFVTPPDNDLSSKKYQQFIIRVLNIARKVIRYNLKEYKLNCNKTQLPFLQEKIERRHSSRHRNDPSEGRHSQNENPEDKH